MLVGYNSLIPASRLSSVEIICSHQELQAEISWDIHVRYTGVISIFFVVVEIFDDFLEHDAAQVF